MTTLLELKQKALMEEFKELGQRIAALPAGQVRLELKRRRNGLTAEILQVNQAMVREQVNSPNPKDVAPVHFVPDPDWDEFNKKRERVIAQAKGETEDE